MTEVYKCIHKLNPAFMWEIFKIKTTPYNLRIGKLTKLPKTETKCYGINAFIFRGSILWNSVPNETRSRIGLKNPAFSLMSREGRDRTKQIQKQDVLHPMVRPGGRVHWAYYPETWIT